MSAAAQPARVVVRRLRPARVRRTRRVLSRLRGCRGQPRRSALLDRYCAEIGRAPSSILRSIHLPASYDQPGVAREAIGAAIDAGFRHSVLGLPAPYPADVARWVTDELISTSA